MASWRPSLSCFIHLLLYLPLRNYCLSRIVFLEILLRRKRTIEWNENKEKKNNCFFDKLDITSLMPSANREETSSEERKEKKKKRIKYTIQKREESIWNVADWSTVRESLVVEYLVYNDACMILGWIVCILFSLYLVMGKCVFTRMFNV